MQIVIHLCGKSMQTLALRALVLVMITGMAQAKPDLEGTWLVTKSQALLTPANGEPIPFTAEGRKIYEDNKASALKGDYEFDETMDRCASPGVPRLMLSPKRFKILERPGIVLFLFEWNRLFRQIDLRDDATIENSKPLEGGEGFDQFAQEKLLGSQMGHTRGRWEGNVLVAETDTFVDFKLLDGLIQTSDELKLAERFRLKDKNTLEDRITISDPKTFTQPWEVVLTYKRQAEAAFPEDICLERRNQGEAPWPKPEVAKP